MTGGWWLAALIVPAVAGVVRSLFALWRHRRWLDSVERLAEVVRPGDRIRCRNADGAVVEIMSDAAKRPRRVRVDSVRVSGCDRAC